MSVSDDELATRTGVPLRTLARWEAIGLVARDHDGGFGGDAAEVGLDAEFLERLWVAGGLGDQRELFDDDLEMLRTLKVARELAISDDVIVQLVRTSADALGRVADAQVRLFHLHVHERLRAEGLSGDDLEDQVQAIGDALIGAVEPTVLYWHRQGGRRALRDDMLLQLEEIGDEFMVVFPSADGAVGCGLSLARSVSQQPDFPGLRLGVHVGPALYWEGDYLGSSVNIAARVAAEAGRSQSLATRAVRDDTDVPDVRWRPLASRKLEGLADPIELFEIEPTDDRGASAIGPVTGGRA